MTVHLIIGWTLAFWAMVSMLLTAVSGIEIAQRDKTGTNAVPRNTAGSQTLAEQALASLDFLKAEGKGLEFHARRKVATTNHLPS